MQAVRKYRGNLIERYACESLYQTIIRKQVPPSFVVTRLNRLEPGDHTAFPIAISSSVSKKSHPYSNFSRPWGRQLTEHSVVPGPLRR